MKRFITILLAVMFTNVLVPLQTFAQDKTVTLVVSGEASTKDEAIKQALRSAIEQAFGTFVSSNTQILNDELVKDEIITLTSGNIEQFKEIFASRTSIGTYKVTLQATVSIGKLTKYAQNKGMTTELSGATFAMNMKMRKLNKANEVSALNNLILNLRQIARNGLFDYSLTTSDPKVDNNMYDIDVNVNIEANENFWTFFNVMHKQLEAISLSKQEVEDYKKANIPINSMWMDYPDQKYNKITHTYYFRNELPSFRYWMAGFSFIESQLSFKITDNLNNNYYFSYSADKVKWNPKITKDIYVLHFYSPLEETTPNNDYYSYPSAYYTYYTFHFFTNGKTKISEDWYFEPMEISSAHSHHIFPIVLSYTEEELAKLNRISVEKSYVSYWE